ncbi:MAG: N-acyl homoserine lactonase family protein [Archaeoglobaceae archaeon]|nr:N-acyl homoserine lactonase family protein [Archaeoglobaceae archaeon]MDW8118691.1 N-acyl homoserine lactonase family protein [Archaeoglobaceae archaeon]
MFRIKPLKQAEISVPLGAVAMLGDMRFLVSGPVYVWLIEGGDKKILVDAGVSEPKNGLVHGFPCKDGGEKGLRDALSSANIKPEEVETLVITHLHFDHVANAKLFSDARIFVQKREWESAMNPPMHYREIYERDLFEPLEEMDLCLVNGDVEIEKGINLILLPGHTKGLQGVLVEAQSGNYLISGDHFYSYINLRPPKVPIEFEDESGQKVSIGSNLPFVPPGLHVDLSEWFDSCFKALSLVRRSRILPGHEPSIEGQEFS